MVQKALRPFLTVSTLLSLLILTATHAASISSSDDRQLTEVLAFDENLLTGHLDNGLRYYIRKNSQPEKQAVLQLCVNAGSINELEEERGIAHLLEHVVFKGSPNFENVTAFNDYFSSHGIQFAADNNAFTSFDETGYFFIIPTDDQELLEKTVAALGDFAGRAFLRADDIETERPIVLDELQLRNSVMLRNYKVLMPAIMAETQYPDRLPIGTIETVTNASQQLIKNFYDTWYTPDNQAIVAVGDFEPETILELVKKEFGGLKSRSTKESRNVPTQQANPKFGSSVFFVDKENVHPSCNFFFYQGNQTPQTVQDLRSLICKIIATSILTQRMVARSYEPAATFQAAGASMLLNMFKDNSFTSIASMAKDNKVFETSAEVTLLIKQLVEHGILKDELTRTKALLINSNNQLMVNANKLQHGYFQESYAKYFQNGNILHAASVESVAMLENQLIESIMTEDVNLVLNELFDFSKVVYHFGLNDADYTQIGKTAGEENINKMLNSLKDAATVPYQAPETAQPITLSQQEATGEVITDIPEIDAKKITLANGITVYFKRSNFSENHININGFAGGGLDCLQEAPYVGRIAPAAIHSMGFGGIKPFQWSEILSDKPGLSVYASLDLHSRNVAATTRREDLQFCLNLMMLNMTAPNNLQDLYAIFQDNAKSAIRNKQNSPQALFAEKTQDIIFSHPTLFKPNTEEMVDALNIEGAIGLYLAAFSNIGEFVFSICGNIELDELVSILNKTLGVLPTSGASGWYAVPINVEFPSETIRSEFEQKSQQQTITYVVFPFTQEVSLQNKNITTLYEIALNKRLIEVLRNANGKVYTPSARISQLNDLFVGLSDNSNRLKCFFSCDKENITVVTDLLIDLLNDLQATGFTTEEISQAKQVTKNHLNQTFKNNIAWNLYLIDRHVRNNGAYDSLETLAEQIDALSEQDVNNFAQNLINPNHYFAHSLVAEA